MGLKKIRREISVSHPAHLQHSSNYPETGIYTYKIYKQKSSVMQNKTRTPQVPNNKCDIELKVSNEQNYYHNKTNQPEYT